MIEDLPVPARNVLVGLRGTVSSMWACAGSWDDALLFRLAMIAEYRPNR